MAAPKQAVSALPASAPRISLLTSAVVINERERWEAGFAYEPESCGTSASAAFNPCEVVSLPATAPEDQSGSVDVEVFGIVVEESCSTFGSASRDWRGRATRKLAACESSLIEEELWSGAIAQAAGWNNKRLASPDADTLSDFPANDPSFALSCLEQALADCNCGSRGMIHATPQVVSLWSKDGMLRREGGLILTINDTIVVPGSGYDGSSPDGDAAAEGSVWAYATGMVHIRLSPPIITPDSIEEATDRASNRATFYAQRLVAASWDCCHFAMELDVSACGIGGAGS